MSPEPAQASTPLLFYGFWFHSEWKSRSFQWSGPCYLATSALPHSSSLGHIKHILISTLLHPVSTPRVFSGLSPHSSQVSTQMLCLVRHSLTTLPETVTCVRSPLIPAPPSLPIPSASLFYCIATYYHEPAIHWHVFIICIIWRKYILHEIKSFKKDPLLSLLSCHSKHSVNH